MIEKLTPYKHIIWDWNGTLLNDLDLTLKAINSQVKKFNLVMPTKDEHRKNFGFPIQDYYKRIGFDLENNCFKKIADEFVEEYFESFHTADLFEGTKGLLESLKYEGKLQSILSASFQEHLDFALGQHDIRHFFENVFGIHHHLADSKVQRGLELIEKSHVPKNETLLIGDTDHDLEVGQEMGVEVLLVADGHQSYERLKELHHNVLETRFFSNDDL